MDDHPILREGLAAIFAADPIYRIVGTGGSADEARIIVASHNPDLLFMDLSMPGNVYAAIGAISQLFPNTKIIVFTAFSSVDAALRALDAGATGFVLKGSSFSELFEAVEAVRAGQVYITKNYASQVMSGLRNRAKNEDLRKAIRLSFREKQIVGHLMQARTNKEIAARLTISEKTVKHYMTGLMAKLNVRNRVEVVIEAQRRADLSDHMDTPNDNTDQREEPRPQR